MNIVVASLLFFASAFAPAPAHAAAGTCIDDPAACPNGNHQLCSANGWCGWDCIHYCEGDETQSITAAGFGCYQAWTGQAQGLSASDDADQKAVSACAPLSSVRTSDYRAIADTQKCPGGLMPEAVEADYSCQ